MGGWENTITQQTKLNPQVVKAALKTVEQFTTDLNKFIVSCGLIPVKMGHLLGSTAYIDVDPPTAEYGDIDLQMIAASVYNTKSSYQISKYYNDLIDQFITEKKPLYIYNTGKPTNGHPIFKTNNMHVQVDMLWTSRRLASWDRWRKTPMHGIKGLVMGNLFSTLGEVINMSLQSAVLMKLKDGKPINYQRGRKQDEVVEISADIENFGRDILEYVYEAVNGTLDGIQITNELHYHPGLRTNNVQISDIVHTIKGLADSFELNGLYGKHVLADLMNAEDLINTYLKHYLDKADKAGKGAKLNKAKTPAELEKVQELRDKIEKGTNIVKQSFAMQ